MCSGRETPTSWRPLSAEEYSILRRKQAEIDAMKAYEDRKKPCQSVAGFRRASEFTLESLVHPIPARTKVG